MPSRHRFGAFFYPGAVFEMLSLQGVIVGLTALNAVLAILWRPINDPIYTMFDGVTAAGELILVVAIQLELSGHANVPVELLVTVSLAIVICNAGKQVRCLDFRAPSRATCGSPQTVVQS